jgi:NAD(P)-dependent dehydrogenase (short-subunit alcohol dehydrogenase family)
MGGTRTAFITGGARGIGAAIAEELRRRGYDVVAPARAELDLSRPESIEAYLARRDARPVDVLVNNAGINFLKAVTELDPATWSGMLQVNLSAALRLTQAFAPGMEQRGWGRILNISTVFSVVTKERRAAYSMTKAGLNALTRSAAVEYGPRGVLVNALCPGYVETALTTQNNSPAELEAIRASIPLRRLATPPELAAVAGFLCSEECSYLTGQTVIVDGGFTCR